MIKCVNALFIYMLNGTTITYADVGVHLAEEDNCLGGKNKMNAYHQKVANWLTLNKLFLLQQKQS